MWPFDKPIEQITEADLVGLAGRSEDRHLDYKQALYTGGNARPEFAADVAAFANTSGGCLILGANNDGALCGLGTINADAEIGRLTGWIAQEAEPRVPNLRIRAIPLQNLGHAIVIQIPRSWIGPHQVRQTGLFFERTDHGKQKLNVDQLRRAFREGPDLAERIRRYRNERLGLIMADETPVLLQVRPRFVLHAVPLQPFASETPVSLGNHARFRDLLHRLFRGDSARAPQINLDGIICETDRGPSPGYVQLFRDGTIEIVRCMAPPESNKNILQISWIEKWIIQLIESLPEIYGKCDIEQSPVTVMASLIGMGGRRFAFSSESRMDLGDVPPIKRDLLLIPPIQIPALDHPAKTLAKPLIDLLWRLAGREESPNYLPGGCWHQS